MISDVQESAGAAALRIGVSPADRDGTVDGADPAIYPDLALIIGGAHCSGRG